MKAIFFDRGDTLVQFGEPDYEAGLKEIRASMAPAKTLDSAALRQFHEAFLKKIDSYREHSNIEVNALHYYELLARYFGIQFNRPYEEICRRYHLAAQRFSPLPGAPQVLDELKRRGFLLGLVTNTFLPHSVIAAEFKTLALYDYFDTVVCSSEIIFRKPDRMIFEVALRSLTASASEALFVGDDYYADIAGAKEVGMKTVWLNPRRVAVAGEVKPDYEIVELKEILKFTESNAGGSPVK